MLLNHTAAFAQFTTATQIAKPTSDLQIPPLQAAEEISAMAAVTLIETDKGWKSARHLSVGDLVHTLDGGLARIATVTLCELPRFSSQLWFIPQGALNNCDALRITSGQRLLITSALCERLYGAPDILIPVSALAGFRGIRPCRGISQTQTVELTFDKEEIIFAQSGTMLICPATNGFSDGFFRTLDYGEARGLLTLMEGAHFSPDISAFSGAIAA